MRLVELKSEAQLDAQILHRARTPLVGQRTALINQLRATLLERGFVIAKGRRQLEVRLAELLNDAEPPALLSGRIVQLIEDMRAEWAELDRRIAALTAEFVQQAQADRAVRRLAGIPGFAALNATALVAAIGAGETFCWPETSRPGSGSCRGRRGRAASRVSWGHEAGQHVAAHAADPRRSGGAAVACGEPDRDGKLAPRPSRAHAQEQGRRGARR